MKIAVFDKTGTLTKGNFEVVKVFASNQNEDDLLKLASTYKTEYGEYLKYIAEKE